MQAEGVRTDPESDRVELLRRILEREQNRAIVYAEAREVGDSLISFFEILAESTEQPIEEGKLWNSKREQLS